MTRSQRASGFPYDTSGFQLRYGSMTRRLGSFWPLCQLLELKGGTVFHLTNDQWAQLVGLVGGFVSEEPRIADLEAAIRTPNRFSSGQGFGLSASERAVVESYAMHRAKEYLLKQ